MIVSFSEETDAIQAYLIPFSGIALSFLFVAQAGISTSFKDFLLRFEPTGDDGHRKELEPQATALLYKGFRYKLRFLQGSVHLELSVQGDGQGHLPYIVLQEGLPILI